MSFVIENIADRIGTVTLNHPKEVNPLGKHTDRRHRRVARADGRATSQGGGPAGEARVAKGLLRRATT